MVEFGVLDPMNRQDVASWMELLDETTRVDLPDFPSGVASMRIVELFRQSSYRRFERVIAKRDGRVVGVAELNMPLNDNTHMVEFELDVHPDHRHSGIGTALLAEAERRAAEHGRNTLITFVPATVEGGPVRSEAGPVFARRNGYEAGLDELHSVADLTTVSPAELATVTQTAWKKADGYELVQWADHAPDDVVGGVAYLEGRMSTDAPQGQLDIQQENIDAARIRETETGRVLRGQLSLNTAVRHSQTGAVVGWTFLTVNPTQEKDAWQGTTIVDPDHRGHRLGLLIKAANHRLLADYRPHMRYVHTWNAEENTYMLDVNGRLGYRPVDKWVAFQKKL